MNDPTDFPAVIRARVHDGAIDRVTRFFAASLAEAFVELIQNGRRAGATELAVLTEAIPEAEASGGIRVTVISPSTGTSSTPTGRSPRTTRTSGRSSARRSPPSVTSNTSWPPPAMH